MQLRPYQQQNKTDVYNAWQAGNRNVLSVLPTGAGKTVIFSDIIREEPAPSCAIAHRQELVTQISMALARDGVKHRIEGPKSVIRLAVNQHMEELGRSYYEPSAPAAVAGVDTLIRKTKDPIFMDWARSVRLWVQDEAHHLLTTNKWGRGVAMFPNARGLGVTATPCRADNRGLGRWAHGLFDTMVEGPPMRWLIEEGFLTDYKIYAPPSDFNREALRESVSGNTGDFNPQKLKVITRNSQIIGDVVAHYLRLAPGKMGITFATDVETAHDIAAKFNAAGVPAAVVHAKTPDAERISIMRRFKNRELLQIVNVDIFGEGTDVPALEVISFARATASYGLYSQQFGRALRILEGKSHAIIIDHVGNVEAHGLPDRPRVWTLDAPERGARSQRVTGIPVRSCDECTAVYERCYNRCPYCGAPYIPAGRSTPEQVDGDLIELDPATLAAMRGEVHNVDRDVSLYRAELAGKYAPLIAQASHCKRHVQRQEYQEALRSSIAWWGAFQRSLGRPDSEAYRRFYFTFGIDVLSAQALNTSEAVALAEKINYKIGELAA